MTKIFFVFKYLAAYLAFFFHMGCAYQLGYSRRVLPGGYQQIAIPVFENKTQEVGIETYFTNALIRRFAQSEVARVTRKSVAPLTLVGAIESIEYVHVAQVEGTNKGNGGTSISETLPEHTVLTTDYRILIITRISLRRNSDRKIVWSSTFSSEKVYSAPQVGSPILNSVNPLYNHSARQLNISQMAQNMMDEAHDRMTENF